MFNINTVYGRRFQKVALIFLFLIQSVALIITWYTPATGYEASIYSSTPMILWISLIFSMIIGITLIVQSISYPVSYRGFIWNIGILIVFLCYAVALGLYIIRGYHMWCMSGDPATHIGRINVILSTGHVPPALINPITHVYLSEIILLTNLDLVFLHKIVPLIFGLLCVNFMYLLVRIISSNQITPILAIVITCTLNYGWYLNLVPNGLSNLFFPLVLFLTFQYLRRNKISWGILLITVVILYPAFHPLPAIFLGVVFLTLWMPTKLLDIKRAFRENRGDILKFIYFDHILLTYMLILSIWFVFWMSSYNMWDFTIKTIYQTISSGGGPSQMINLLDQISYAQEYGYNIVEQILKQMGGPMILFILSVLSIPLLWKTFSNNREEKYIFSLYGPFGFLCIFIPSLYVFDLFFSPLRLLVYASMLGTVFVAYFLSHHLLGNKNSKNQIKSLFVTLFTIVLLVGLFLLGLLSLYPSPYNLTPSHQTTESEVLGMKYFYDRRDVNIPVSGITVSPGRFADALLSPEERSVQHLSLYLRDQDKVQWHFGYEVHPSISDSYDKETSLIITQRDKDIYRDYFPDMAQFRFTVSDFERLNYDPGINFLYSNGGFDLWNIASGLKLR